MKILANFYVKKYKIFFYSLLLRSNSHPFVHKSSLPEKCSGPYISAFGLNTDQKNSEYGHFLRSTQYDIVEQNVCQNFAQTNIHGAIFLEKLL